MNLSTHKSKCFDVPHVLSNWPAKSRFISSLRSDKSDNFCVFCEPRMTLRFLPAFTISKVFLMVINFSV